jgi:hypothetical protein
VWKWWRRWELAKIIGRHSLSGWLLTPSTRFAYPQVISRTFASFRVARFHISAGQVPLMCRIRFPAAPPEKAGQRTKALASVLFHHRLINISRLSSHQTLETLGADPEFSAMMVRVD